MKLRITLHASRIVLALAFVACLAGSVSAQTPPNCQISGVVRRLTPDGPVVAAGVKLRITPTDANGPLVSTLPFYTNPSDVNGVVSFTLIQGIQVEIKGPVIKFADGLTVTVPSTLTANLDDLPPTTTFPATGFLVKNQGTPLPSLVSSINLAGAGVVTTQPGGGAALITINGGISALTGDGTASGIGSVPFTLATVNSNVGSFGGSTAIPVITVDAKGRITAVSTAAISATPFSDSSALVKNSSDPTKLLILDASLLTTGTTRTLQAPDRNGKIITDADSGTVTNGMLAGGIGNSKLANSSLTVNGTTNQINGGGIVSLGGSLTLSLPQNIHTGATPQFAGLGLGVAAPSGTVQRVHVAAGLNLDVSAFSTSDVAIYSLNDAQNSFTPLMLGASYVSFRSASTPTVGIDAGNNRILGTSGTIFGWVSSTTDVRTFPDSGFTRISTNLIGVSATPSGFDGSLKLTNLTAMGTVAINGNGVNLTSGNTSDFFKIDNWSVLGTPESLRIYGQTSFAYPFYIQTNGIAISGGLQAASIDTSSLRAFTSILLGVNGDLNLYRDAANTLAQRNGANAQQFNLYNTYTDASNYERFETTWSANYLYMQAAKAGTGAARSLVLNSLASAGTYFQVNATNIAQVSSTGLIFTTDNTYDIGASGATRPRSIYVGTNITAGGVAQIGSSAGSTSAPLLVLGTSDTTTGLYQRATAFGIWNFSSGNSAILEFGPSGIVTSAGKGYRFGDSGFQVDASLVRNAAGVVEFNRGTAGSNIGALISSVASGVNYLNISSAITTASPSIVAQGSDTNIGVRISGKGSAGVGIMVAPSSTFPVELSGVRISNGGAGYLYFDDFSVGIVRNPGSEANLFGTTVRLNPSSGATKYGAADAASPVAQTISVQNVVAGTSNTAGADWTFVGSQGTGTGAGGSIIFKVAPAGSTGTSANALASVLTIDSTKTSTFAWKTVVNHPTANADWLSLQYSGTEYVKFGLVAGTAYGMLSGSGFGGNTNGFAIGTAPAIFSTTTWFAGTASAAFVTGSNAANTVPVLNINSVGYTTKPGLSIDLTAAQTANPFQIKDSSAAVLVSITSAGALVLPSVNTNTNPSFSIGSVNTGLTARTSTLITGLSNGTPIWGWGAGVLRMAQNAPIQWSSAADPWAGGYSGIVGVASGVLAFTEPNNSTGGTYSAIAQTPTQITSDQNNYAPGGPSMFQRWSSDASRNVTGLSFGVASVSGQTHYIWNAGSQNIVLVNESASSTAANRFTTSTGTDITITANRVVLVMYDATSSRWRAVLLP